VKFKRDTETGSFTSPRFFIGENASRGSAAEIRFTGPERYEATDARTGPYKVREPFMCTSAST